METNMLPQTMNRGCTNMLQISKDCEHLRNLLHSAAGVALRQTNSIEMGKMKLNADLQEKPSECSRESRRSTAGVALRQTNSIEMGKMKLNADLQEKPSECSRESRRSTVGVAVRPTNEETAVIVNRDPQVKVSEDSENSLNSRIIRCRPFTQESTDDINNDQCERCLTRTSESSEHSPESHVETTAKESKPQDQLRSRVQDIFGTQEAYGGDSSESSQESSSCVGNNVSVPRLSWFQSVSKFVGLTAAWQQDKAEGHSIGANTVSSAKENIAPVH